MTQPAGPHPAGPFLRPVSVLDLPDEGVELTVEASPEEREALARDLGLPAIRALTGTFRLTGTRRRVHVGGQVEAVIGQVCVVTLDPFDSEIREEVEVDFAAPGAEPARPGADAPDEIVNGTIDLGALAAEFLVLGLDPHPRKPGVDFTFETADDGRESPFAALGRLKRDA